MTWGKRCAKCGVDLSRGHSGSYCGNCSKKRELEEIKATRRRRFGK